VNIKLFSSTSPGRIIEISGYPGGNHAFIPDPLPPKWEWPERLWPSLLRAREELARLDGVGQHLPNPLLLIRPLQRREAQRSSILEGTYATAVQLALFEIDRQDPELTPDAADSAKEVTNYARALQIHGSKKDALPLSLRLIRDFHRMLLEGVRRAKAEPGEFRKSQIQIGMPARYIPPPADILPGCLDSLEKYMHAAPKRFDPLVEAFLIHYQFEAVHPFTDGNGRVGRLLMAVMIQEWCNLAAPWLYMSPYFEKNRDEYIDHLFRVSTEGKWEEWIAFCLTGVVEQSLDAQARCIRLLALRDDFHRRLARQKNPARLVHIVDGLFAEPVLTFARLMRTERITYPTARKDIDRLKQLGILREVRLKKRRQLGYFCRELFEIIYE